MAVQIDLPAGLRNSSMVDPPIGSPQAWTYLISRVWSQWLQQQIINRLQSSPQRLQEVPLIGQSASIGSTPINLGLIPSGLYRVSYFVRITTPAATSSSVQVIIGFTEGGVTCSVSGVAVNGNVTNSVGTGSFLLRSDQSAPINYSTTYASNPAGTMVYKLDIVVENVA